MSNQPYNGPRKAAAQNVFTEWKMRLAARPQNNASLDQRGNPRAPWLMFSIKNNQPQLTVNTNVENDKDYGKIVGAMDSFTWYAVLEAVRQAANNTMLDENGQPTQILSFDCKGYTFFGGKRSDAPVVKSRVLVGRTENDEVFMSVVAQGRPNIQFIFGPGEWHSVSDHTGKALAIPAQAKLYALGYTTMMEQLTAQTMIAEFKTTEQIAAEKEANKQSHGGGGGGYQKSNNNGGGNNYQKPAYQKPAAPAPAYGSDGADDGELPW